MSLSFRKLTALVLSLAIFVSTLPSVNASASTAASPASISVLYTQPENGVAPVSPPASTPAAVMEAELPYESPYINGCILIKTYEQLSAIGSGAPVKSGDLDEFGKGSSVLDPYGKKVTYSLDADYVIAADIPLPGGEWSLPEHFTGTISPSETGETAVYDVSSNTIRIANVYQLGILSAADRDELPVMSGDLYCASFGSGSFIFPDGTESKEGYLTYSRKHNYVLSAAFTSEAGSTDALNAAKAGWNDPNEQHKDGRDYFGQAAIDIGGTTYVLIGNKAQLYAINNASDTTVYGPVYEVFQRRDSLLNWNEDNIVEETATLVYPGDADLISNIALGNGTSADFTNEPMYDGNNGILSSDRYHSLTAIPDLVGRTRTIYCTVDPATGKYSIDSRTNPYSSLKYSKSGNYIVFRDVSLDGQAWDPLMFSGTMYGIVNDPLVQNGEMNIDISVKPVISDFNVTVNDPINLNQYTGVGFFGTLKGTFNSSALIGNRVTVQNIKLADGYVTNNAVRTRVDETVVNLVLQGLGIVVGGLLDGLLYVLTGGRIVGVRELLTGLLNTRAKDPSSLATGGFAGRISGDAYIADCVTENVSVYSVLTNFENAVADKKIVGMGGFVGYTEGETEYEGLSGILGGLVDVLAGLLNVIPGLGLGDLINLLLENTLPVGQLIPVGYKKPVIERCGVRELTDFTMEDGKIAVGGFAGTICGTDVTDCYIEDSDITVTADTFGGGFCGIARDAIIEGTLSGLGIDVLAALHPQSTMINCEIRNTPVTVTGGSHLGGFIGALANSYTINDTVDEDSPVTVSGEGEYIGGFCGLATLGTLFTLSDYLITGESLLSTVKGLVTGLLSDNQNQSLLDLGGVAPAGIMGCALVGETTVEGESCVGGFLGRGNGVRLMNSSEDNLMLLSRYKRDGAAPDVEEQNIEVENLVSVTAETDYAGGLAGYLTTANVGGLLGDTLGIGQFMPFKIMNASVTGADGGYTVTAGGNDAGGAVGFALGGDIDLVNAYELASVTADNRAGGFVGTTGPGNLLGGGGLDLQLLGLHLVKIDSLLSLAEGVRTTFVESSVSGVTPNGFTVEATGDNGVDGQKRFCSGGYVGFASSAEMKDCHVYNLHYTKANMYDAATGGFVGLSTTGGLAGVLPEETNTLDAVKVGQLVNAVPYLIPEYNGCDVRFINDGYAEGWAAGGFAGDFLSGKVNTETEYGYDCGTTEVPWSVYDVHHVRGTLYAGGFAGRAQAGALADAGGGLSILGGISSVSISADQILGVAQVYVPVIKYAGVNSPDGFSVYAIEAKEHTHGYAGGFIGYGCGIQVSYSDVYRLKTGAVTEPADLEGRDGNSYMTFNTDPNNIPYTVAGGEYAGGYIGHMDVGSAASVGGGLKLLGNSLQLTNVLDALSVVVSTIEHSDVTGCPGGFSVVASGHVDTGNGTYDADGIGYAGGYAGKISGGHIQDGNCYNFYYIIGEIAAGGYAGEAEPGDVAGVLDEGTLSLLGNVDSLASLVQDFVPTIRNSETTSVPCGGAVRAQSPSDTLIQRGMAGGYIGHAVGTQIWGISDDPWKSENDAIGINGETVYWDPITQENPNYTIGHYLGEKRECAAIRIRSVYGAEYAGGFAGLEECGSTAQTGGIGLLGNLVSTENLLGALEAVYSTFRHCAVYGPLEKIDPATWNAWVSHIGVYGGFASAMLNEGTVSTQTELDAILSKYIYGYHVVAGRSEFNNAPNLILNGCAGGFVGAMHSGVITDSHAEDAKLVKAMRSAGGFVGDMQTKGLAEFGRVSLLGLNLNVGNLIKAGNVFVPAITNGNVTGYQRGLTVEAFGSKENDNGYAGGYVGATYGGQINGGIANMLLNVFGRNCIGGFAGKAASASVLDANTNNASNGFLQRLLNSVISTPNDLADVLQATICTIKNAEVHPADPDYGIVIDGAYPGGIADYAGGFVGSMEASVIGERRNANDRIIVDGLHVVNARLYAGGFFGIADVGSVADVGGTEGTSVLDLIQAGNVSLLDAFRSYVYHAEVRGVNSGILVFAHEYNATGIMHTYRESGGAGGFGGGLMNGTVEHSTVTNLRYAQAPNYAAGFIAYLGRNGGVTVDKAKITDDSVIGKLLYALGLELGLNAQVLNIVGSTVKECSVSGWEDGFAAVTTRTQVPISEVVDISALCGSASAGFAGFADISQINDCTVTNAAIISSPQLAGGFVGRANVSYIVDTEISSKLTEVVVRIVNALIRLLYLDKLQDADLIGLDSSLLGLHLLSDGDVLAVNLLGLRIAVSLSKNDEEYGGNTDAAIITIGSSTIKLPCDENGLTGETSNISVTLIEGNRTCIKNSTVSGIADGYDVFGGGAKQEADGTDVLGYAGGFIAINDNGYLSHNEALYCDTVKGTAELVGPFAGSSIASSRPISYLEGNDNYFNIYREATGNTVVQTAGGTEFAQSVADNATGTDYNRYRVLHRGVINGLTDLVGASETGVVDRPLDAYISSAKAALMFDAENSVPVMTYSDPVIPSNLIDPCSETFDLTINKIWDDSNDALGYRPSSVTVNIVQVAVGSNPPSALVVTGQPAAIPTDIITVTITANDQLAWSPAWQTVVKDLPVCDRSGNTVTYYQYYVIETAPANYTVHYATDRDSAAVNITNHCVMEPEPEMPGTGGWGVYPLCLIALITLCFAAVVDRRRRRTAEHK